MPLDTATRATAPSASRLLDEFLTLRDDVLREGRTIVHSWGRIERRAFRISAHNLAHYLALRQHDLRELQIRLMPWGLSSLGRLESRVEASLDAVALALAHLTGRPVPIDVRPASAPRFFRGERLLERNAACLFGPMSNSPRHVHIMATLPKEAAEDDQLLIDLLARGVNAVRINCTHGNPMVWERMIARLRAAEQVTGRRAKVLMDLAGPKLRTGQIVDFGERLREDSLVLLAPACLPDSVEYPFQATVEPAEVIDRVELGERLWIDDGKVGLIAEERIPEGLLARVVQIDPRGFQLKPEKGINLPDTALGLPPLTSKDLQDLDFVAAHADLIGYSFLNSPADIELLQNQLAVRRPVDWRRIGLVAKIETPRALTDLPAIILAAARRQPFAIMIARGDLAVEIGFERLAEMQEEILWLAEAAQVPVIWATQVLEQLVKKGFPTRGEMTDAAMAARAECVMLNKGPFVNRAVEALDRLLVRMAEHQSKKTSRMRALKSWHSPVALAETKD